MSNPFRIRAAWLSIVALVCLASAAPAATVSYSLTMVESLPVLRNPTNQFVRQNAGWQPQTAIMLARTSPYFELRNTSNEGSITELVVTIGNTDKNFDLAQFVEASPGVGFSLADPDALIGNLKSDQLKINFTGLDPGKFVRFRATLGSDIPGPTPIVDFRQTLFHLNEMDLPGDNSVVTVSFTGVEGSTSLIKTMPNFHMYRTTNLSMAPVLEYSEDYVKPFVLRDEGELSPGPLVPEPESVALWGGGLVGLLVLAVRRKRASRQMA